MLALVEKKSPRPRNRWAPDALEFQWEPFESVIEEALPLLKRHYAELGLTGEPFDPNWRALFAMACAHKDLRIVTARDDGRLVGYCGGLRVKYLASQETKVIMVNAIYLEDTYRGSLVPIKIFLGMMLDFAREEGAIRLEMAPQGRHRRGIGRMLRYLGWAPSPDPAWVLEV